MLIPFYLLAVLLSNILSLSAFEFYPEFYSSDGSDEFPVSASKFEQHHSHCHNKTVAYDSSICMNVDTGNSGSNQYRNIDKFAEDFKQALLSVPAMKKFLKVKVPIPKLTNIVYNLGYTLLHDYDYPEPEFASEALARSLGLYHSFPQSVYFNMLGYAIGRFLLSENIELGHNAVRCYSYVLERAIESSCIVRVEELYQAYVDAFVSFVVGIGFEFGDKANVLFQLLTVELLAFSKCNSH